MQQVFAHFRFQNLNKKISELQNFHANYKYTLMDYSQSKLKELGRIAANSQNLESSEVFQNYENLFFQTLNKGATTKNKLNTFLHILGYFKKHLTSKDKGHLLNLINLFREGTISSHGISELFYFLVKKYNVSYLNNQHYFSPYPKELN